MKKVFIFFNPEHVFLCLIVEYFALTCKSHGSLMLCFSIVSSNCQAFDPSSCFVCFIVRKILV